MDWNHRISFEYEPLNVFTHKYDNNILHFFFVITAALIFDPNTMVCSVKTYIVLEWVCCDLILGCFITVTLLPGMHLAILISIWVDEIFFIHTLCLLLYVFLAQAGKYLLFNWILDISGSPLGVFQWIEIIEFHSNMIHWISLHTTMTIMFYIFFEITAALFQFWC